MKKSLLITLDWPPNHGGVANYLWNVYSRLPRDFSVILAPLDGPGKPSGSVNVYRRKLIGSFWPKWLRAYLEAIKIIKNEQIEAIHISHILPMGYVAWMIKKTLGLPYVVYLHGMDVVLVQKSSWKKWWAKKILEECDLVVVNSRFTMGEAIKAGSGEKKIEILYPCPNISGMTDNQPSEKIILSVGRLVPRKGFDKVIEAMPKILRAVPDAKYFVVGDGPDKERLKILIKNLHLEDTVLFYNNVGNDELSDFYSKCDLFAMPARRIGGDVEGFGIVYLEAALFSKPSIAGNTGGAPEAVLDNQTGIIVNQEKTDEISMAIIKLLQDDSLRKRLGETAKNRVQNEFTWEKQINKVINKF